MWNKPYIVAELSGEHCGSLGRAVALIKAAKDAGADAVKLQCFDPERLAAKRAGRMSLEGTPWEGRDLLDLYRQTHTPQEWFPTLFLVARDFGITLFSSVFDPEDVDFLERLDCPAYKISAFEFADSYLASRVGRTGRPIILSIASEVPDDVISRVRGSIPYDVEFAFLHCVSKYPCPPEQAALRRIARLSEWVGTVGFSDHTPGIDVAVRAVKEYGARIIEKHLTLSRADGGPDAAFSLEPQELRALVEAVR